MPARYVSDTTRSNLAMLVAAAAGTGLVTLDVWRRGEWGEVAGPELVTRGVLFCWPLFAAGYLIWTHLSYRDRGPRALSSAARRERRSRGTLWAALFGTGDATDWTLAGSLVAVVLMLVVALDPGYRSDPIYIGLGLASVAGAWAIMVYSFALQYLHLDTQKQDDGSAHLVLHVDGDPRFGDYLTLAVLMSAMAAAAPADLRSRAAWTLARVNVLFAFAFNTVILAMTVSVLFSSIVG
ncbi:DUF1345 domain-containing protein [Microbacterium sp. gxy059]|uniref:DUF1345 domain-containing protein n=1 Tax=Microbacterium sp. gxy059 TaxID=2957199 RepID=UPI003D98536B